MLEGTAKALLNLLQRIDQEPDLTYESLVTTQRQAIKDEQDKLDELLKLEGLCDATTLKTPSGRKRRRDRGKKRLTAKQGQQIDDEELERRQIEDADQPDDSGPSTSN